MDNDIVIDSADFFVIKEDYARKMEYKKYKDRMANNTKVMFENQSLFNSKLAECDQAINEYNKKTLELQDKINEYQGYIDSMKTTESNE